MIDIILNYIVKLIMGTFNKMLYIGKKNRQQKEVANAKQKASAARKSSDRAYDEFNFKLQQYRKQQSELQLSRTVRRVLNGSGQAAADNSKAGAGNQDSGGAAKD